MADAYNRHRDLLGLPSGVGGIVVGYALGSWWLGLGLVILSLYPYNRIYAAYFSEAKTHPRRRDIPTNVLFVVGQIVFWLIALFIVLGLKHAWYAI